MSNCVHKMAWIAEDVPMMVQPHPELRPLSELEPSPAQKKEQGVHDTVKSDQSVVKSRHRIGSSQEKIKVHKFGRKNIALAFR